MIAIFFNLNESIDNVSTVIFNSLGFRSILEGDSSNVLGGIYYCCNVFGSQIRLEYNSYDWDDVYNYMITVKDDVLVKPDIDDSLCKKIMEIIVAILSKNLNITIAVELQNGELEIVR